MTHPEVVYRLQHLTPEGGDRFRADGDLTIRGRTKPISTTITLNIGAESASASGTLSVDRTDYLLGVGPCFPSATKAFGYSAPRTFLVGAKKNF